MENASPSLLTEEREEVMVSEKGRCLRKTHFLKPFAASIDGTIAELPRHDHDQRFSDSSSLQLKRLSLRGFFSGFWLADRHFLSWLGKMEALHEPIWKKAGIFEAIKASTYKVTKDPSLILSVAEKWCSETKSFVFSWGEATITLEDVMVLLGFSVLGSPVFAPLESSEMRDSAKKLEKVRRDSSGKRRELVRGGSWTSSFMDRGDQMEHEAFLVLWLSLFVFPDSSRHSISRHVIPVAVRLARGERIALAPAVLAFLYKDLGRICDFAGGKYAGKVNLKSLFKLVQVWTCERFRNIRPKVREIPEGEPRIARWSKLQKRSKNVRLSFDDFDWRPYTKPLKNWNPLRFYLEEAIWVTVDDSVDDEFVSFARCVTVSQLSGNGFVEDYFPHRVAMQFGLAQDLPSLVTHRNFTEKEAYDDYNKSLDGLKLYMPSRLDRGLVTARYQDWWLKSVSDFLGSKKVQKESTDDDDDDDVSPKILPLSEVVQKLEKGFPAKCRKSRMHRLAKRYKVSESAHMKQALEDDDENSMDEEDDNMSIAQLIRVRKKFSDEEQTGGDGSQSLGKRTRRYLAADSDDDSGPCQKFVSNKIEQGSEEKDETAKSPEITRQTCDDVYEDRDVKRCIEKFCSEVKKEEEDVNKRLRQRKLAIEGIALELETRILKVEKSLANVRQWKTRGH